MTDLQPIDRLEITQIDIQFATALHNQTGHGPRPCLIECAAIRHFGINRSSWSQVRAGLFSLVVADRTYNMSPEAKYIAQRWDDHQTAEPGQIDLYTPPTIYPLPPAGKHSA